MGVSVEMEGGCGVWWGLSVGGRCGDRRGGRDETRPLRFWRRQWAMQAIWFFMCGCSECDGILEAEFRRLHLGAGRNWRRYSWRLLRGSSSLMRVSNLDGSIL